MLSFIVIVVIFISYLILQKDNQNSSKFLAATLIAYTLTIFWMILYLSKDSYYYNIVNNYFSLPKPIWKQLMFADIPRNLIIRLLNFSSLAVIYFGYLFSISFRNRNKVNKKFEFSKIVLIVLCIQLITYDPGLYFYTYRAVYPQFFNIIALRKIMDIYHQITITFNIGVILLSIVQLYRSYLEVHRLEFIRNYLMGEGICYILMMISYVIIFWFSPSQLTNVSKIADYVTYLTVPLSQNRIIFTMYPYYLLITMILCAYFIYGLIKIQKQMNNKEFSIKKQIDAADTTSKIFCHYMKNEILAIQSEIELMSETAENADGIKEVLNRCNHLYERLDTIHRGTKKTKLNLVETDMGSYMNRLLENMKINFRNCTLKFRIEDTNASVMMDSMYFEQAIKNIIENALDAMETTPKDRKDLVITVQKASNWIVLCIEDQGIGIPKENMKNIFTPLYSSKPIAKHWGVGLSLAHRIIMAHGGKIEVESVQNSGTVFRIFLPDMGKFLGLSKSIQEGI